MAGRGRKGVLGPAHKGTVGSTYVRLTLMGGKSTVGFQAGRKSFQQETGSEAGPLLIEARGPRIRS